MLIESDFFVGEHLRWNLGWASPNYAGAFVVALLALAFGFTRSRWRWGFFVLELGGFFLLAKTYSRGALVAWGVAWLFGALSTNGLFPKMRRLWLGRMVALGMILYCVGFQWSRADTPSTSTVQADRSVGNRLPLWKGGLKMIAAAPLRGWGAGESGRAYQHWFQDLARDERFMTMVNSYLSVAVEYGLPVFAVSLLMLCLPIVWAWQLARAGSFLAMAAGASLVSWLVANEFSTLWVEWRLWVVPCIVYTLLMRVFLKRRLAQLNLILLTGGLALVTTTAFYAVGVTLSQGESLVICPKGEDVVMTFKSMASAEWHVWPDADVLGNLWGKELRHWFLEKEPPLRLVVHPAFDGKLKESPPKVNGTLLFGKQAARIRFRFPPSCEILYIIHPTVSPPDETMKLPERVVVYFPEIDEVGNRLAWERWAEEQGAELIVSKGSGVDIRSVWPVVLSEVEEEDSGQ